MKRDGTEKEQSVVAVAVEVRLYLREAEAGVHVLRGSLAEAGLG